MPLTKQVDEALYINGVRWINENAQDSSLTDTIKQAFLNFNAQSPKEKMHLVTTLNTLLKLNRLPEAIADSLPWLITRLDSLSVLPDEMLFEIAGFLKKSDLTTLGCVSKRMHMLFQPTNQRLDKFLQRVAFGKQNEVETLFTAVYAGNDEKRQIALRYQGAFTDYSGRKFNCTGYEYAYWSKDVHMCRMLDRYMDDKTKAIMRERIHVIEQSGLHYQHAGNQYCCPHFDFTPLKSAYQTYMDNAQAMWDARDLAGLRAAWLNIGKSQRDVPAHVAQEYCKPGLFFPLPALNPAEAPSNTLERKLDIWIGNPIRLFSWYPFSPDDCLRLGLDFALLRANLHKCMDEDYPGVGKVHSDYKALMCLDEMRTVELAQLRDYLNRPSGYGVKSA